MGGRQHHWHSWILRLRQIHIIPRYSVPIDSSLGCHFVNGRSVLDTLEDRPLLVVSNLT